MLAAGTESEELPDALPMRGRFAAASKGREPAVVAFVKLLLERPEPLDEDETWAAGSSRQHVQTPRRGEASPPSPAWPGQNVARAAPTDPGAGTHLDGHKAGLQTWYPGALEGPGMDTEDTHKRTKPRAGFPSFFFAIVSSCG